MLTCSHVESRRELGGARGGRVLNIERAKRDRWIRGVCGGVANTYGWNPNVVRLVTVVLAVIIPGPSTLLAFVLYLVLSFVLPESEEF
jgi:phage shock protein C